MFQNNFEIQSDFTPSDLRFCNFFVIFRKTEIAISIKNFPASQNIIARLYKYKLQCKIKDKATAKELLGGDNST